MAIVFEHLPHTRSHLRRIQYRRAIRPRLSSSGSIGCERLHLDVVLLISGLADHEPVLRARRRRGDSYPALGSQGMEDLIKRLFKAAGVAGFTGHDLRRTFISLVTEVSGDELLGMRLARDRVPGVNDRYVSRDLPALLAEFSPLSLL